MCLLIPIPQQAHVEVGYGMVNFIAVGRLVT